MDAIGQRGTSSLPALWATPVSPSLNRSDTCNTATPDSYAAYTELRRDALLRIRDELDAHVVEMEKRAMRAVQQATVTIESSRAKEVECFRFLRSVEDAIAIALQAKQQADAEVAQCRALAAAEKATLERELTELRCCTLHAQEAAARAEVGQLESEQRQGVVLLQQWGLEEQLQRDILSVDERFRDMVEGIQRTVAEQKRWADTECAVYEEKVRLAAARGLSHLHHQRRVGALPTDPALPYRTQTHLSHSERELRRYVAHPPWKWRGPPGAARNHCSAMALSPPVTAWQ